MAHNPFSRIILLLKRRLIFPLIPVVLLLILATVLLTRLETKKTIQTVRQDDRVTYIEGDFLTKIQTPEGEQYLLKDPNPDNVAMIERTFPVKKPAGAFRIVVSGGSFMMGDPYVDPLPVPGNHPPGFGGLPDWLQALLQARFPSHRFEVINGAIGGQNSFRVRQVIDRLLDADPDLVIVATGNNEGFVPATLFNEHLHHWIVYRALKRTLRPDPNPGQRNWFPPQDPDSQRIENHFRSNIDAMVKAAGKKGVPLALATMPIHLKYDGPIPKMIGDASDFPASDPWIRKGRRLKEKGEYDKAIEAFTKSKHQAFAARYIGECFERMGQFETAKDFYRVYVQNEPMGRTRPSYNVYVREVCENMHVPLIDLEKAMDNLSPTGIPDGSLFFDNCHLTWQGYFHMALAAVEALVGRKLIPAGDGEPRHSPTVDALIEQNHWQALYHYNPPRWWELPLAEP